MKKFRDLVAATMSPDAQRRAHELAQTDLAEMELVELREALRVRQSDLAKKMEVTQAAISRLERRPNVLLNTLANYIEGLGGQLEVRAVLPDRTIRLTHLLATIERKKIRTKNHNRRKASSEKLKREHAMA
jgi:transcriptional regulator with XRE-family HTH domain